MEVERPPIAVVNLNQDANQVVYQMRQDYLVRENNLAAMIEIIMAQNGVIVSLQRPNYIGPLLKYVLKMKLLRGWKVPKCTKFSCDTSESTV